MLRRRTLAVAPLARPHPCCCGLLPLARPATWRAAAAAVARGRRWASDGASAADARQQAPTQPEPPALVGAINGAMSTHPIGCITYVMACRYAVFFPVLYTVRHLELAVPTELALAYVLTRPLVKLRLPLELGLAALLARLCPTLTQVKVSALLGLLPQPPPPAPPERRSTLAGQFPLPPPRGPAHQRSWARPRQPAARPCRPALLPVYPRALPPPSPPPPASDPVNTVMQKLSGPADRYGAAFYVSRDLVGVSSMLGPPLYPTFIHLLWISLWSLLGHHSSAGARALSVAAAKLVDRLCVPMTPDLVRCGQV